MHASEKVQSLMARGAVIHCPASVYIDDYVDLKRISPEITIHPGCRIRGATTSIGPGSEFGEEGPVTIFDCQLAGNVKLQGGSFAGAVILAGVKFGPCAQVREAALLEEHASCAHSVGLKQTILFPYVTMGSLINFCDCTMSGGSDAKNHSEVGSSYVHFNYTPHQDKATASLIGDVPRGVMLDQRPIFLGGQGGLVGPCILEFGTIVAAGTICRKDVTEQGRLVFGAGTRSSGTTGYEPVIYGDISRVITNNFIYIGNLHALYQWYKHVRVLFMVDQFDKACLEGALNVLGMMLKERIKRLSALAESMERSITAARAKHGEGLPEHPFGLQAKFMNKWPELRARMEFKYTEEVASSLRTAFLADVNTASAQSYLNMVQSLSPAARATGSAWLKNIVDSTSSLSESLAC